MKTLQQKAQEGDVHQIEADRAEEWDKGQFDDSLVSADDMQRIKRGIDNRISSRYNIFKIIRRIAITVAAVLLPALLITSVYLYKENSQLASSETTIATGIGERARITLPDGTKISLNAESQLTYINGEFNKNSRNITFDGEAYFDVAKDAARAFVVNSHGLEVKVLGTKFNFFARGGETTSTLSLESGSLLFTSNKTGGYIVLTPNQMVFLTRSTGYFVVCASEGG